MHLSIIIPAFNEEKNLAINIKKFNEYLSRQPYEYEIIVVNDGSTDKTAAIAQELALSIKNLHLINNQINRGKGFTVRQGLLAAKGEYRLFIDADGATSIEHIDKIWPHFKKGCNVVIGSRHPKDAAEARIEIAQPFWKVFLGKFGNFLIRKTLISGIWDTQCGFKAFTAEAVKNILPKTKINRWAIDIEILAIAKKLNYKIGKIPVRWTDAGYSRVKIQGYFSTLEETAKIKWNLMTNKYK